MATVGEGYFERDGVRLHYLEWGGPVAGRPSMLLLHGLGSNARFWERTAAELDGRHLLALDQRSHGLSDRPVEGNANPTFVADAHALVERAGLDRPVVAGHSWGAVIALEYAAAHPSETGALSVMDGPVWANGVNWDDVKDFVQPPFPLFPGLADAYRNQAAYLPDAWAEDLERFVAAGLVPEAGGFRSTLTVPVRYDILRAMFGADTPALWAKVTCPVAVLLARSGPGEFVRMKERGAEELRAHKPGARIRWFDTPHDIPLYQPAEIARELVKLAEEAAGRRGEVTA
jgi:pimeloyl-ACP methyl ester carboxylesterase